MIGAKHISEDTTSVHDSDDQKLQSLRRLTISSIDPKERKIKLPTWSRRQLSFSLLGLVLFGVSAGIVAVDAIRIEVPNASIDHATTSILTENSSNGKISQLLSSKTTAPSIIAAGYVVARRQATVAAEITGRVMFLPVLEGQFVRKGAILATLDDSMARADLAAQTFDRAASGLAVQALKAQLSDAHQILSRTETLRRQGFATDAALGAAASRASTLEAQVAQARSALAANDARTERMRRQVDNFVIRAPFDGVIIELNAQVGEIISPMSAGGGFTRTGICTIVDMNSLELEVDVSEAYISKIHLGQRASATLDAYPNSKFPTVVSAIIPTANKERATVTVRLSFIEKNGSILPNMATKVAFTQYIPERISLSSKTVRRDGPEIWQNVVR